MKSRRIVLIAFMLVAVLTMGIGFAAYSTTLAIHGTTQVSAEAIDFTNAVQFIGATTSNEAFGTATANGQEATFNVSGMTACNDTVTFTYTISNGSEYDVDIQITTNPTPATPSKCTVSTALSSNTIAAGQTITATVVVVLTEDVDTVTAPINWTIEYTATSIG
jgi:hypothetical protein